MTQTQTFDEWFATFCQNYYAGGYPDQRFGQAFINALHAAGKHTQANSLIYGINDPFYSDEVCENTYAFLGRVWDWPNG